MASPAVDRDPKTEFMKAMKPDRILILHYSAPPTVGGVERVMHAHAHLFVDAGYQVTVVAGTGEEKALPVGAKLEVIPLLSSLHPEVVKASLALEAGFIPENFTELEKQIEAVLEPVVRSASLVIAHNVFTKHFNLPLTAALCSLLDQNKLRGCVAWCHDLTWTSMHSQSKVFPSYPWDLLRTPHPGIRYVTVSKFRREELAGLFLNHPGDIEVIYNGVDPQELLGLSQATMDLLEKLHIWADDLVLLMPVRVTQAKNIELAIRLAAVLKEREIRPKIILTGPPDPHDKDNMTYFQSLLALRKELKVEREMVFVYESNPQGDEPYIVDMQMIGDLYRVSDALFMPSHREGFGMPILEAGLAGLPVFCSAFPTADELGGDDVTIFPADASPNSVADLILNRMTANPGWRLRKNVRQNLTWQGIFQQKILPLLEKGVR